jgi:hypothetical protein
MILSPWFSDEKELRDSGWKHGMDGRERSMNAGWDSIVMKLLPISTSVGYEEGSGGMQIVGTKYTTWIHTPKRIEETEKKKKRDLFRKPVWTRRRRWTCMIFPFYGCVAEFNIMRKVKMRNMNCLGDIPSTYYILSPPEPDRRRRRRRRRRR